MVRTMYRDLPYFHEVLEIYKDPCPYYKNGRCAVAPSKICDAVVVHERCMTIQHYSCNLFKRTEYMKKRFLDED